MASGHPTDKFSFMYQPDTHKSKNRLAAGMNPVYSPVQPGAPYGNPKNMAFAGYPGGYPAAAPTYTPNLYQTGSPGYPPGYTAGTPYKVPPTQTNGAPPPYTPSPSPYQTAMYPIRSAYPQQNLYAQVGLPPRLVTPTRQLLWLRIKCEVCSHHASTGSIVAKRLIVGCMEQTCFFAVVYKECFQILTL
ncbi:Myelin-associated neurite-outgrowth inhibitor [Merluccius polli]|uniref:Myelin-associated neurite-outgrowth inhibitor n=1 Tax=Merluccius polli TaxID=89951 RepID=A0AA47NZN7_MERPO|nr:Myelin-associated neurite-outgrowth inhibitor [Merluccius polli]